MASACGAPCWVSLTARDLRVAEDFYGAVLGWRFVSSSLGTEFRVATEGDEAIAGLTELATPWQLAVSWRVYFQVDDADLAAERISERGGTVAVGPVQLGDGRAVLAADPAGGSFGLWQGEHPHSWAVGAGPAPAWLELHTPDAFAAALFYGTVFDWAHDPSHTVTYEEQHEEVVIRVDQESIAGLRGGGVHGAADPRSRPRWQVYFRIDDLDAAVAAAADKGGEIVLPPQETCPGRTATLRDPEGAVFSLLTE